MPKRGFQLAALGLVWGVSAEVLAFTHIVRPTETLASIAEDMYGKVQFERILVAANQLDAQSGVGIVPGMRLEIPAVSHYRVQPGDTFATIAAEFLGSAERAFALAEANDSKPWLAPDEGAELTVPYNLRIVCTGQETSSGLAYKFLGDRKKAWGLEQYNLRQGKAITRGETFLIPLTDLALTQEGKEAARGSELARKSQGSGEQRERQRAVEARLPELSRAVRTGRYVDAVTEASDSLAVGDLTRHQLAVIHRQLLESYVALGANGRAAQSCQLWLKNDEHARLDPMLLSPKLLAACRTAAEAQKPAEKDDARRQSP